MSGLARPDNRYSEAVYYPSVAPEQFRPDDDVFTAIPYLRGFRLSEPQAIYQPPTLLDLCAAGAVPADQFADSQSNLPTITLSVEVAPYLDSFHELSSYAVDGFLRAPEREGLEATAEEIRLASCAASDQEFWSEEYWRAMQDEEACFVEEQQLAETRQRKSGLAGSSTIPQAPFRRLSTATCTSSQWNSVTNATPQGHAAAHRAAGKRGRSAAAALAERRRFSKPRVSHTGDAFPEGSQGATGSASRSRAVCAPPASRRAAAGYSSRRAAAEPAGRARPAARPSSQPPLPPKPLPSAPPGPPAPGPSSPVAPAEHWANPATPRLFGTAAERAQQPTVTANCSAAPWHSTRTERSKILSTSGAVPQQAEVDGSPLKRPVCANSSVGYLVPTPKSYKRRQKCCVTM